MSNQSLMNHTSMIVHYMCVGVQTSNDHASMQVVYIACSADVWSRNVSDSEVYVDMGVPDVQDMADPGILESQNRGISRTLEARRRVALWSREVPRSDRNDEKVAVFVILKEFELFPFKTRRNDVFEKWEPKGT